MFKLPTTMMSRDVCRVLALAAVLCGVAGAASAQEATPDPALDNPTIERSEAGSDSALSGLRSLASLDMTLGADGRPRRALRFRFDSATRAMRTLGVEADNCATVLRTTNRPSSVAGESSRPGLTVALNCRFY